MVSAVQEPIRIFALGRFEVRRGGRVLCNDDWSRRKAATLLQRLAVERRLHRDQAIEFLWPGSDPDAGANNLYRTIYVLRQTLDDGLGVESADATFAFEHGVLSLAEQVWVDVHEFEHLCSQMSTSSTTPDRSLLERAVELYEGELLSDERYAEWTFTRRDQLRHSYREVSLAMAVHFRDAGEYDRAIELLTSFLADEPADEPIHRELIHTYALAGRRHDALRQYQTCVEALATELDVPPEPETAALHSKILNGELTAAPTPSQTPLNPPSSAEPASLNPGSEQDAPLVGRQREFETVLSWLQVAWEGNGRTVLLAGDTGVGKTRLAYEALRAAAAEGMTTLWGSAYEQEERLPYQPFVEAFDRYLAGHLHSSEGNPITHFKRLVSDGGQGGQWALFNAAATFLIDLAGMGRTGTSEETPVVLFLDDLHAADEASLHLFQYLARQTRTSPVVLLATYRTDVPSTGSAFRTLLNTLYRERLSDSLTLTPLPEAAVGRLLADTLGGDVEQGLVETVHSTTAGNPFYIEEITQSLLGDDRVEQQDGQWRLKTGVELRIPAGLGGLLHERVTLLGPSVHLALTTAAVMGREFEFDVLRQSVGLPAGELMDALDLTLTGRLLEEAESGYRFRHPLIRRVLYDSLSRARRAWLHRRTAEAIETVYATRPRGLEPHIEELAYHYDCSDRRNQALDYLVQAGRKAAQMYAFGVAANYYERALTLLDALGSSDAEQRFQLLESIGGYHALLADTPEAVNAFNRALNLTDDGRWQLQPIDRARLHRRAAMALLTAGQVDEAGEHLQQAMGALDESDNSLELVHVLYNLAQLHWHRNEYREAFDVAQHSLAVAERLEDPDAMARAFEMLALACHSLGEWQQGLKFEERRASLTGSDLDVSDAFDVHL